MEEQEWKKLKLSLERPYKDDDGQPIPVLLDVTPEGQLVYEPPQDLTTTLGENLHRIFLERGHDFFDKRHDQPREELPADEGEDSRQKSPSEATQPMSPEELFKMRMEIVPQLHIALGEMSQARDLLSVILATTPSSTSIPSLTQPNQSSQPSQGLDLPPSSLTATTVNKPPPIQSVQAFNAQLVIGGKDRALRQASELFKSAAEDIERGRSRGEIYWVDALKIRRSNWGLIPAPLPLGSATGKGADKTTKDFLVSFGLEQSPPLYRRRAIGRIPITNHKSPDLEFPLRQHTRLQISLTVQGTNGSVHRAVNRFLKKHEPSLDETLQEAQAEVVEQEIFSILIREASNLRTASARVSERLISIEASEETLLEFELVDSDGDSPSSDAPYLEATCDFIFSALHLLLLRIHSHIKAQRLRQNPVQQTTEQMIPAMLQPIIDMLQYQAFCDRICAEIYKVVRGLRQAGVSTTLRLNKVGDSGDQLVSLLRNNLTLTVGGECVLRIDNRYTFRFTFNSPSTLIAHLPQATLTIASIHQLSQLLNDEISSCLLHGICELGTELCEYVHATWFVDLLTGRSVGRWEGKVLNLHVFVGEDGDIQCAASQLEGRLASPNVESYNGVSHQAAFFQWVRSVIGKALVKP
ncbi:Mediator of RNA polymerase II transcription subunit 17 [Abortiporus biennis]